MLIVFLIVSILAVMASLTYWYCRQVYSRNDKITLLAQEYEKALKSHDRDYAEEVGRGYYSVLRGGQLTQEDEKALAFELAVMFRSDVLWKKMSSYSTSLSKS